MQSKLFHVLVTGTLCAVFSTTPFALGQEGAGDSDKVLLSPEYEKLLVQATENGKVRVIIGVTGAYPIAKKFDLQASKDARATLIAAEPGLEINQNSLEWVIPFVAARVDAATLQRLYSSPLVTSISADHENHLLDTGSDALIGAPAVWAKGFVGTNQAVAILDTGVQSSHPFFGSRVVGEACFSGNGAATTPPLYSNCPGDVASATGSPAGEPCENYPGYPGCEHGTHVAGDAAGNGFYSGGVGYGGVAIQAPILAVQVFTCYWTGSTCLESAYDSDIISGLNWVYSQRGTTQIAAVNLSLGAGGSDYTSACDSVNFAMTTAFYMLKSVGIAVVVAAGNDGFTDGISYPACISLAVSVAAVDDSDNVASFSDVGPNASLFAPGVNVDSSVPTSTYESLSGTSMAAPHVTGAWSLLKQQNPSASVDQILNTLATTGKPITVPGTTRTIPRIQLNVAIGPVPAAMTSPANGSKLTGSLTEFSWTAGIGVSQYMLYIGTTSGAHDILNYNVGSATSVVVLNMPTNGEKLYVTLYSLAGSTWLHNSYYYFASGPAVTLSPPSLNFGDQAINTVSTAKQVTLKNTGNSSLTITGKAIIGANAGDYPLTTTCGSSLAANASCTFSVTFKPTASGTRSAALSITDNASGSPQAVGLTGTGK